MTHVLGMKKKKMEINIFSENFSFFSLNEKHGVMLFTGLLLNL